MKPLITLILFFSLSLAGFGQANKPYTDSAFEADSHFKCIVGGDHIYNSDTTFLQEDYVPLDSYLLLAVFGRQSNNDSIGFTNKAEAKNLMMNGKKEGKWIEYYIDGTDIDLTTDSTNSVFFVLTVYKDGLAIGMRRWYYKSGEINAIINYKEGRRDGIYKDYYKSGKLKTLDTYIDGRLNGVSKNYYENGKLKDKIVYIDDTVKEWTNYDENGNEIKPK